MKKLQEIDNIAIFQSPSEEKLQICNLTACQGKVIPVYPVLLSNSVESDIGAFELLYVLTSSKAKSAVTVAAFPPLLGANQFSMLSFKTTNFKNFNKKFFLLSVHGYSKFFIMSYAQTLIEKLKVTFAR